MFENIDAYILFNESNRFYFTKMQTSAGCVILTKNEKIFITDFRYIEVAKKTLSDFNVVQLSGKLMDAVALEINRVGARKAGFEDEQMSVAAFSALKAALPDTEFLPVSKEIAILRSIKAEDEISKIAAAQVVAQKALTKVKAGIKVGMTEKEVAAEILYEMQLLGAEGASFETIVAFGSNSAMPHHRTSSRRLNKNDIILIDMGAKLNGYCSDMTRTFSIGDVGEKLEDLHELVLEGQMMALRQIKAGVTGREADMIVREFFKANGFEKEFGHSLGHSLGIDVHETPGLSSASDTVLATNMVVTVEPGLYIEGIGGVRIEDMIVIKDNLSLNLTKMDKNLY